MSNNDLMNKFRLLLDKKKEGRKDSNSEYNDGKNGSENFPEKSTNNSTTINRQDKVEGVGSSSLDTTHNDSSPGRLDPPRHSVFDLISKFNKPEDKPNAEKKLDNSNNNLNNNDSNNEKMRNSKNKTMVQNSLKKIYAEIYPEKETKNSDDQEKNHNLVVNPIKEDSKNNTDTQNKEKSQMQNLSLNTINSINTAQKPKDEKIVECENNPNDYNDSHPKTNSNDENINCSEKNSDENPNLIEDVPRKSVHQLTKMNQKLGIKKVHVRKYPRHSTKDKFSNIGIGKISEYLQALELSKEKLNSPKRMKEMGFHEKDLPLINDLVNLYQDEEHKQKQRSEQKRNTIAYNIRAPRIDEVEENFSEEKYSDGSFASDPDEENLGNNDKNYDRKEVSSFKGDGPEPIVFHDEDVQYSEAPKINTNINNNSSNLVIQQSDINYVPSKLRENSNLVISKETNYNFSPTKKKEYTIQNISEQKFNFELKSFIPENRGEELCYNEGSRLSFISVKPKSRNEKLDISSACELFLKPKEKRFTISMHSNIDYIPTEALCNASDLNIKSDREELIMIRDNLNFTHLDNSIIVGNKSILQREKLLNKDNEVLKNFYTTNQNNSKYQKNIINSLDSIAVAQYTIHSSIPLDPIFLDIICINCYECVKFSEVDYHSEICVIQPDENYHEQQEEEDYNARIFKMHESLKKKHSEIYKTNDQCLIIIYEELTNLIYEILINNNSIEELDKSISRLNEILNSKLININSHYKLTLLVLGKRVSQLVYTKLQDMEKILLCVNDEVSFEVEDEETSPENQQRVKLLKMELADLEKQTQTTKNEIEQWRKESKFLENMLRKPNMNTEMLSDIQSDVLSRRDESFDGMTMITAQASEYDSCDVGNMKDVNEVLDLNNEEVARKYFLTIGLNLKFRWGEKIKENVSIADLYEKAKINNIPPSEWQNFITKSLGV